MASQGIVPDLAIPRAPRNVERIVAVRVEVQEVAQATGASRFRALIGETNIARSVNPASSLRVLVVLAAPFLGAMGCGTGEPGTETSGAPKQVRSLLELSDRRDRAVDSLLEIVSHRPAGTPAVGERLEAFKWLGLLRRADPVVTQALVENLTAVGVPHVIQGEWDERETFYPATLALATLRVGNPTGLLKAALRANDPLRHRLTAWILRGAFDAPEAMVIELDRDLDLRFHAAAMALRTEILDPVNEVGPPPELLAIWNSDEFQSSSTGGPPDWMGGVSQIYSDLVEADRVVSDLLLAPDSHGDEPLLEDWVLWAARTLLSPGSELRATDQRLDVARLPVGPASPWCLNSALTWQAHFPVAGFAATTARIEGLEGALQQRPREKDPLVVDLATWAVVESFGGGSAASLILRAKAAGIEKNPEAASRLSAAAERATMWKPHSIPPADVLEELGMSASEFRELCRP